MGEHDRGGERPGSVDVRRFLKLISSDALSATDVPAATASWQRISLFAVTMDGWSVSPEQCADIANTMAARYRSTGQLPDDLTELRTALFFEQRRYRHIGEAPRGEEMAYIRALVEAIRTAVTARDTR